MLTKNYLYLIILFAGCVFGCASIGPFSSSFDPPNNYTGKKIYWYNNGQKASQIWYKDGKKDGNEYFWYLNGRQKHLTEYKKGRQHGIEIYWFPNGIKCYEIHFRTGKRHGTWTRWNEQGQKLYLWEYKDGRRIRALYYKNGKPWKGNICIKDNKTKTGWIEKEFRRGEIVRIRPCVPVIPITQNDQKKESAQNKPQDE